jgi:spore germination protein KA/spore germination protein
MDLLKRLLHDRVMDNNGEGQPEKHDSEGQETPATVDLLSSDLADNLQRVQTTFADCKDFQVFHWSYGPGLSCAASSVYFNSLTQKKEFSFFKATLQDLVAHQIGKGTDVTPQDVAAFFEHSGSSTHEGILVHRFDQLVHYVLDGYVVNLFDQWDKAMAYKASGVERRQVSEPTSEAVVQGPKESTVEDLGKNLGLLRSRLRSANFKIIRFDAAGESRTTVAYGYMEGIVNQDVLAEFKRRIAPAQSAEVLEVSYIEELMEDSTYSPFPQCRYSERPDVAVASLLSGKIITLVSGSGSILICPATLAELMQSSEDYYQRTVISSLIRIMRTVAFFIALMLPSIYIALSTFHPELIPTVLLLAIVNTREGIPFPAIFEALIMEFFFELLREAGVRLPRPVGSAVSIVGALVIGEASIRAGIASPIMVIIVALTGIASFSMAQFSFATSLRVLRFPLMIFSAFLGGFGMMIALLLIWLHLANLRPLGQPYLAPLAPFQLKQLRDVLVRAPLQILLRSPRHMHLKKTRL